MAEIEADVVERVLRWCAEAGRQAGAAEVRAALAPLGWDELLAVKALLADPPPARPLGPHALADLARGTPADVAAEREREGRYRREDEGQGAEVAAPPAPAEAPKPRPPRARARGRARPEFVIHRARDRVSAAPEGERDPRRPLEELLRPEGRSVLERLVRRSGATRARLAAALGEAYRSPEGDGVRPEQVEALLREHGLARAFERRERDETLHAVRAAGGLLGTAAARLGLDAAGLGAAVARLGIAADVERIRDERRADLRARATLGERARLLADEEPRLADLGLAAEFEADLRARLPEHVRALLASGEPLLPALARTLSLPRAAAEALAGRCGIDLSGRSPAPSARGAPPRPSPTPARPRPKAGGGRRPEGPRHRAAAGGERHRAERPGTGVSRPRDLARKPRPASGAPRAAVGRPSPAAGGTAPAGGARPRPGRPGGPRAGAPRAGGPRAGGRPRGRPGGGRRPR